MAKNYDLFNVFRFQPKEATYTVGVELLGVHPEIVSMSLITVTCADGTVGVLRGSVHEVGDAFTDSNIMDALVQKADEFMEMMEV